MKKYRIKGIKSILLGEKEPKSEEIFIIEYRHFGIWFSLKKENYDLFSYYEIPLTFDSLEKAQEYLNKLRELDGNRTRS